MAGPLLIGASTTIADFLLPQVLGEFKSRFPAVVPRLFVANSEAVQDRIAERSLDLGFIEGDSHLPSLVTDVCCDDELQVVCAPSHPLASRIRDVRTRSWNTRTSAASPDRGRARSSTTTSRRRASSPDSLQVVMEAGSPEAIKGLVATGLGFAIMSRATVVKEMRLGRLVQIPLSPPLKRHFSVVYPKERFHSKLVNSFVEFAKERLAACSDPTRHGKRRRSPRVRPR